MRTALDNAMFQTACRYCLDAPELLVAHLNDHLPRRTYLRLTLGNVR